MTPKSTLLLEGEIGEKYFLKPEERAQGKTAPYTFRLRKVTLLGNVSDNLLSGFSIDIRTPMLTPKFREEFVKTIKKHRGSIPLTLYLDDPETHYRIQFYSKKFQVAVSSDFIRELQELGIDHCEAVRK